MLGLGIGLLRGARPPAPPTDAPENLSAPVLSTTTPEVGDTVTCGTGVWINSPQSFSYQWLRDGVEIAGATSNAYLVTEDDIGAELSCEVTATNAIDSTGPEESNATDPIPEPAPEPSFLFLNDSSSFLLLNDGVSKLLLN